MTDDQDREKILSGVRSYYTAKVECYGATPAGVDWNGPESQLLRFDELLRIVRNWNQPFSIADLGCGYGQLYNHIRVRTNDFSYRGYDLSETMIEKAKSLHGGTDNASFAVADRPTQPADYVVASGIFNVKLSVNQSDWKRLMFDTLAVLDQTSEWGFAFNCLTSYSDAHLMRPDLYYAEPGEVFDHCKRRFSRNVALLHDYGLYEFTVLVRKRL